MTILQLYVNTDMVIEQYIFGLKGSQMANTTRVLGVSLSGDRIALYERAAELMAERGMPVTRQRVIAAGLHLLIERLEAAPEPLEYDYRDGRGDALRRWKARQKN